MNKNIGKRIQLCPFHKEKTPSMVVRSDGTYHCYGCGRKGTHDEIEARETLNSLRERVAK